MKPEQFKTKSLTAYDIQRYTHNTARRLLKTSLGCCR